MREALQITDIHSISPFQAVIIWRFTTWLQDVFPVVTCHQTLINLAYNQAYLNFSCHPVLRQVAIHGGEKNQGPRRLG